MMDPALMALLIAIGGVCIGMPAMAAWMLLMARWISIVDAWLDRWLDKGDA